jgi:hypothetical protein
VRSDHTHGSVLFSVRIALVIGIGDLPVEINALHSLRACTGLTEGEQMRYRCHPRAKSCRLTSNRIVASSDQSYPKIFVGCTEGNRGGVMACLRSDSNDKETENKIPYHSLMAVVDFVGITIRVVPAILHTGDTCQLI